MHLASEYHRVAAIVGAGELSLGGLALSLTQLFAGFTVVASDAWCAAKGETVGGGGELKARPYSSSNLEERLRHSLKT